MTRRCLLTWQSKIQCLVCSCSFQFFELEARMVIIKQCTMVNLWFCPQLSVCKKTKTNLGSISTMTGLLGTPSTVAPCEFKVVSIVKPFVFDVVGSGVQDEQSRNRHQRRAEVHGWSSKVGSSTKCAFLSASHISFCKISCDGWKKLQMFQLEKPKE